MECVNFLKEHLSADNAFMLLAQSRLFDEPNLMENCLEIIDRDTCEALRAEGFLEIDHDTLCAVLQRDTLRVNELPLFHAVGVLFCLTVANKFWYSLLSDYYTILASTFRPQRSIAILSATFLP